MCLLDGNQTEACCFSLLRSEHQEPEEHVPSTFISDTTMPGPTQLCFHLPPQTTIHLGSGVMEEKLREVNRIKGSYALVDRYGDEGRVAWMPDLVE